MTNARPFSISTFQELFNDTKNASIRGVLGLSVELWTFESPGGLQVPNFGECWASPPHLAQSRVVTCMDMELQLPIWRYQHWCFHISMLDLIPSFLTFYGLNKRLCLPYQLCNWCHDKGKVLDETFIKLSHTIKDLNLLWVYRHWHNNNCLNLFKVWYFSLETMNPKISPVNTIKAHFSR